MRALFSCPQVCWVWRDCFPGIEFNQIIPHSFSLFAWDLVEKVQHLIWNYSLPQHGEFGIGKFYSFINVRDGTHGWLLTRQMHWYRPLNAFTLKKVTPKNRKYFIGSLHHQVFFNLMWMMLCLVIRYQKRQLMLFSEMRWVMRLWL